jgi:hypothetical protein
MKDVNAKLLKAKADVKTKAADLMRAIQSERGIIDSDRAKIGKVAADKYDGTRQEIDANLKAIESQLDEIEKTLKP